MSVFLLPKEAGNIYRLYAFYKANQKLFLAESVPPNRQAALIRTHLRAEDFKKSANNLLPSGRFGVISLKAVLYYRLDFWAEKYSLIR